MTSQENLNFKNIYTFESENGKKKIEMVFRITLNCNQRCVFCNVVKGKNVLDKQIDMNLIKKEVQKELSKYEDKSKCEIKIVLSGGEPSIHSNFWELVDFFLENSDLLTIQTNAVKFAEEDFLANLEKRKTKPLSFYISFHSHVEDIYNKITLTNDYNKAIVGIKNILKIFNKQSQVEINFVFNKLNIDTFGEYIRFFKENFYSITYFVTLNISSVTGTINKEILVRYSDILETLYSNKDYITDNWIDVHGLLAYNGSQCDLPFCTYKKYIDISNIDTSLLSTYEKIDINSTKLEKCKNCIFNKNCPGILKAYVDRFGEEEFEAFE